jgi:aminomethyltransferase
MTEFGGWACPSSTRASSTNTPEHEDPGGLFDVCHMGQIEVRGPQALELLQWVMSRNLAKQQIGR